MTGSREVCVPCSWVARELWKKLIAWNNEMLIGLDGDFLVNVLGCVWLEPWAR